MADIIELNRDKEGEINSLSGLTFIHTADIHAVPSAWDRVAQFADYYDNIKFVLHAGDYCGGSQKKYVDMYSLTSCKKPMYNCVGNHDCYPGDKRWYLGEKSVTHGLLFNYTDNWDVTFMDIPHPMSYYKDFDNLLWYYYKGTDKAPIHEETRKVLVDILTMLAEKGEKETFQYVRSTLLK